MFTNVHISNIMITLPLIEKKGIPRQYFAALDHLNGGLLIFGVIYEIIYMVVKASYYPEPNSIISHPLLLTPVVISGSFFIRHIYVKMC